MKNIYFTKMQSLGNDFVVIDQLKNPIIFDGRNQYNAFNLETKGFEYYQIGKE